MACSQIVLNYGVSAPLCGPILDRVPIVLNRSPSLGHRAGLFPVGFDHGGPSATDRLTSSIGVLLLIALCGRSSL
jgi:hypothetical protein